MESGVSSTINAADASFTGDRILILKYPASSTISQILDGNKLSLSFSLNSSDNGNGVSEILDKINSQLLSQKQSLVKFDNTTLDYKATLNGGPTTSTVSYQVKLHPIIIDLITTADGSFPYIADIDWRSIALEEPLIVNTEKYGQIDINHPIGGLEKLAPEVATKIQNTTLAAVFETPNLDFTDFGTSMNNWHFLFDATGAQAGAAGLGFSVTEEGSKIVSIYSLGESSFREGTHTVKETSASAEIDGVNVEVDGLTAPPSGQMQLGGFSQVQQIGGGKEYLLVTSDVPNDYNESSSQESSDEKTGSWETFTDSTGLSLRYPPSSYIFNAPEQIFGLPIQIFLELPTLERNTVIISLLDEKYIASQEKTLNHTIPWSDKFDSNAIKKFAEFSTDAIFNNTGALLIEDIRSDNKIIDGKNVTTYVISNSLPDSSYERNQHILFTNSEMNKLIDISITPPISDQMIPETKAMIKKIIESIEF